MFSRFNKRSLDEDTSTTVLSTPASLSDGEQSLKGIHSSVEELIALQCPARMLDLCKRSPAIAAAVGDYASRFRGRGMDYQESRTYQAGDDIRSMDWRVTARSGKPHTKLYEEERERPVVLLVDFSPSLFFGSTKALKSVVATQTAALLGWAAVNKGDRIGALLINGKHKELPPKRGKQGVLNLIRELVAFSHPETGLLNTNTTNNSHLSEELQRLRRIARPGSLIILVSDFYAVDSAHPDIQRHLQGLCQHNDVLAMQVSDPLEKAAPPAGRYAVTDGHQADMLDTYSAQGKEHYNEYFQRHHERLRELMFKNKIPLLTVSTADYVPKRLHGYFGVKKCPIDKAQLERIMDTT